MFAYFLLQSTQLGFVPILVIVVLVLLVLVLAWRGQLLRVSARRQSIQAVDEQKSIRAQLETTTQLLAETQERLEETQEQLGRAREQQAKTHEQLISVQRQLEATRRQTPEAENASPLGDDPLSNEAWVKLTRECVTLFDELDRKSIGMDPPRQEMAGYVCSQLEEILERCGVTIITGDAAFDESRHRPFPAVSRVTAGTAITETLSPGFVVGPRVLRRARVKLADEAG